MCAMPGCMARRCCSPARRGGYGKPWAFPTRSTTTRRWSPATRRTARRSRPSRWRSPGTGTSPGKRWRSRSETRWRRCDVDLFDSLFGTSMPWWEFILRATLVYLVVLLLVRITGKRTVGQFTPFDLILVVLLGESVGHSMVGGDESLVGGLILAATLLGLNWAVGFISARSRRFDEAIEGRPVLLARNGELFRDVLKRQSLSEREFERAMRDADCP